MGLFSGKKTITVSSTVYNLAGDEATRPNFLKNGIYAAVMSPYNPYLGETIVGNYLKGPGIGQRNFFRWAQRQSYIGLPTYSVSQEREVDIDVVAPHIPTPDPPSGLLLRIQEANIVTGDYSHIVEQYVLENNPDEYNTAYVSQYDPVTNDITITWVDETTDVFDAGDYSPDKYYITATYYHYLPGEVLDLVTGSTTVGVLTKPSTTGYSLDSSANTGIVNYAMDYDERTITTYVGSGAPADTDVTTSESDDVDFNGLDETWSKITFEGGDGTTEETRNKEHFLEISEYRQVYQDDTQVSLEVNENTPSAGITQTIEVRRLLDHLRPIWDWRIDTQETILLSIVNGAKLFSYEIGSTPAIAALDALLVDVTVSAEDAEYFPYMPIRLKNKSITDPIYDDITGSGLYAITNRAYRRASGGGQRFKQIVDEVEDNDSIDDIDYAFTHHGVGLNVIEPACRRYIYEWFKGLIPLQNTGSGFIAAFQADVATYLAEVADMNDWVFDQGDSGRTRYGDGPPTTPKLTMPEKTTVRLACADSQLKNLDMRITWINCDEVTGISGVAQSGMVQGDIRLVAGTDFTWDVVTGTVARDGSYGGGTTTETHKIEKVVIYSQTAANTYKRIVMWGMVHRNFVYGGESVLITAKEGLADTDPTGFIVPLHYPTVKALGIKDSTQMATANTFIVFNSYEVVKQRWYEGFIGMLIIILVVIVLTLIFAPAGLGAAGGLLGTNVAVGAALGFSGTAAILAGAIVNAIVAIAISQIVGAVSKELFGEKWGAVIATVINLAITLGAGGVDFSNLSELGTAANIMKITSAIANGYEGYTQGAIAEMGDEMAENQERFQKQMKDIDKLLLDLRGTNDLNFNPLYLTDSVKGNDIRGNAGVGYITETLDQFINRTTMTGSDIVEVTLSMVNNFAGLSLELP